MISRLTPGTDGAGESKTRACAEGSERRRQFALLFDPGLAAPSRNRAPTTKLFGTSRLISALASAGHGGTPAGAELERQLRSFLGPSGPSDDLTFIGVRSQGFDQGT